MTSTKHIHVLGFPGTNCEMETARAIRRAGFSSEILRWNDDLEIISNSDGLVIAGGFSYEDRGRSGMIAANDAVGKVIIDMATEGKPILGICNGAQVLVELGIVPGFRMGTVEMSLARNRRINAEGEILGTGFYHDFIFLKSSGAPCAWTHFSGVLRLPIAHGEGRFLAEEAVLEAIQKNGQHALVYCDEEGKEDSHFPVNPNGSALNAAGITNPQGNVLAMMPHPERIEEGQKIFQSLHTFFANPPFQSSVSIPEYSNPAPVREKQLYSLEIFVSLKITDTTEATLQKTARRVFSRPNLTLERRIFWGISTTENPLEIAQELIESEAFFNENKESALFFIEGKWYSVRENTLVETDDPHFSHAILSRENDDLSGQEKSATLQKQSDLSVDVSSGILWEFSETIPEEEIISSGLFGNPVSWHLERV